MVRTSLGVLKDAAPVSYQRIGGERVPVESRYVVEGDGGGYGFAVGAYDPRYPLVIDPGLDYSTFLGGTDGDGGNGIAVDGRGRAYMTGGTSSDDYPTTRGAFDRTFNGVADAFVTKLPTGVVAAITVAVGLLTLRLTRKNLEQQRELEAQRAQGTALKDSWSSGVNEEMYNAKLRSEIYRCRAAWTEAMRTSIVFGHHVCAPRAHL